MEGPYINFKGRGIQFTGCSNASEKDLHALQNMKCTVLLLNTLKAEPYKLYDTNKQDAL